MAAASQRPTKRMESRCTPSTARATLAFEIDGYSLHRGMGNGKFIESTPFSVGGYGWCIRYYPDGECDECKEYVSVFLVILSKRAEARVFHDLRLVDHASGQSSSVESYLQTPPTVFSSLDTYRNHCSWGAPTFKKRSELEASTYLRDDRLVIECDLTVINEPLVVDTPAVKEDEIPPSDLSENLEILLETEEGADVRFIVGGEVFRAHKIVLAARSPVFKAEFYGPMKEKGKREIPVKDMQPDVFMELLHFIYTDSLRSMDDLDGEEYGEMVKHLLVAADRYAMERMKAICEGILCKRIAAKTVATMLALADQHHCNKLKDACVEFLTSSNTMGDVVASQGYVQLKRSCPDVLEDILERVTKSRKS